MQYFFNYGSNLSNKETVPQSNGEVPPVQNSKISFSKRLTRAPANLMVLVAQTAKMIFYGILTFASQHLTYSTSTKWMFQCLKKHLIQDMTSVIFCMQFGYSALFSQDSFVNAYSWSSGVHNLDRMNMFLQNSWNKVPGKAYTEKENGKTVTRTPIHKIIIELPSNRFAFAARIVETIFYATLTVLSQPLALCNYTEKAFLNLETFTIQKMVSIALSLDDSCEYGDQFHITLGKIKEK